MHCQCDSGYSLWGDGATECRKTAERGRGKLAAEYVNAAVREKRDRLLYKTELSLMRHPPKEVAGSWWPMSRLR